MKFIAGLLVISLLVILGTLCLMQYFDVLDPRDSAPVTGTSK